MVKEAAQPNILHNMSTHTTSEKSADDHDLEILAFETPCIDTNPAYDKTFHLMVLNTEYFPILWQYIIIMLS